jgi:hypothetical protein
MKRKIPSAHVLVSSDGAVTWPEQNRKGDLCVYTDSPENLRVLLPKDLSRKGTLYHGKMSGFPKPGKYGYRENLCCPRKRQLWKLWNRDESYL